MHVMLLLRMMKTLTEAMVVLFVVILAFSITFFTMNPAKILPADPVFYMVSLLHFEFFLNCEMIEFHTFWFSVLIKPVPSPCPNGFECYTSINQSIKQKALNHAINQSIHSLLLIFIESTNQSINLSVPWHFKYTQSINQLTTIPKSVFSLNCRGLLVVRVFFSVLDDEKANGTVRWGRRCGVAEGWTEPGDWVLVERYHFTISICMFIGTIMIDMTLSFVHWTTEKPRRRLNVRHLLHLLCHTAGGDFAGVRPDDWRRRRARQLHQSHLGRPDDPPGFDVHIRNAFHVSWIFLVENLSQTRDPHFHFSILLFLKKHLSYSAIVTILLQSLVVSQDN